MNIKKYGTMGVMIGFGFACASGIIGCAAGDGGGGDGEGGSSAEGGGSGSEQGGSGGTSAKGGSGGTSAKGGSGGTSAKGGSGGTTATGGSSATGGTSAKGGSGGTTATGGTSATGGTVGTGGTASNYVPILTDANSVAVDMSKCTFVKGTWDATAGYASLIGLNETATCNLMVPKDGSQIVITAHGQEAEGENATFDLKVDEAAVGTPNTLTTGDKADYPFATTVKAGARKIVVTFTNDMYLPGVYDRNLFLHAIRVKQ